MKRALALLAVAATLVAVLAYGLPVRNEPRRVSIHVDDYPLSGLLYVAFEEGLFDRRGVRVSLQKSPVGQVSVEHMLAGEADLAVAADVVIMDAVLAGNDLAILGSIGQADSDHGVVARRLTSPADLRGKRVGVTLGTSGHFYLDQLLLASGLKPDSVIRVGASPDQLVQFLSSGTVDAVSSWEPILGAARQALSDEAVTLAPAHLHQVIWNLVSTREYARDNADSIERTLAALADAEALARKDPARAQRAVAKHMGMDVSELAAVWARYRLELALDQALVATLEEESRWAISSGRVRAGTPLPNFLAVVDVSHLSRVKPDAVRIIR